jgi:amino acid adenylation domain-containing protein/non-ribosomal peptide synthase protein (TIGR01720 family)
MLKKSEQPIPNEEKISLTPYQLIFYYEWLQNPQRSDYNIVIDNDISGEIDLDRFNDSFKKIANEHFILRHNVSNQAEGIYWRPREPADEIVVYHPKKLSDQQIYELISAPFDLERDRFMRVHLIKLEEKSYRMIFIFPHIVVDGVSTEEIWRKFRQNYNNEPYEIMPLCQQSDCHRRLVAHFDTLLQQNQSAIHDFWRDRLHGVEGVNLTFLRTTTAHDQNARRVIEECLFSFDETVYQRVKRLKYQYKITPYILGQMVLAVLLHKLTGSRDIALAYPIAFNEAKELMYGAHINTLLIDYRFSPESTLQSLINNAVDFFKTLKSTKAKYLPINDIVRYADNPNVLNVGFAQTFFRDHTGGLKNLRDGRVNHEFHIDLVNHLLFEQEEHDNKINYRVRFDRDVLDKHAVQRFVGLYQTLFNHILTRLSEGRADTPIATLPLLDKCQIDLITGLWNQTQNAIVDGQTIVTQFQQTADRWPERTAVVYKDKRLSYRQLNQKSNQLAQYLTRQRAIRNDDIIALCLDRSELMPIAMLAVLKAGAAYVPISPTAPDERIAYILEETRAKVILTEDQYLTRLSNLTVETDTALLPLDSPYFTEQTADCPYDNLALNIAANQLAYVIYTSGTTGRPKGVMIEHQGLINLALSQGKLFGLSETQEPQRCLWYSDYVFDAHVSEIYTALANGHRLHVLEQEKRLDFDALQQYIKQHQIQIATVPPVLLNAQTLLDLERLVVAGDVTQPQIMASYRRHGTTVINAYGPSEASVCSSLHYYQTGDSHLNIGRPLDNVTCYILNQYLQPVPAGISGTLYIGGAGVARGYLNNPPLTARAFIVNPFQTEQQKADGYNGRLYNTGDLARYTDEGNIEYLGRKDSQVKIRGFRIELEEIESRLLSHQDIDKAVVLVKQNAESNTKYLVAYYVSPQAIDKQQLTGYLAKSLPDYMLPHTFFHLAEFPLLLSGKIDRNALPEPQFLDHSDYVAPKNDTERHLCRLFADVLGLNAEELSAESDFFQLGGDSISGIQLVSRIRRQLGVSIGVNDIFAHRTIRTLANCIVTTESVTEAENLNEQGILTGSVPLAPIQQWFFSGVKQGVFNAPHHWNQCFSLRLPALNKALLLQSLRTLSDYHDALRLYFVTDNQSPIGVKQCYHPSLAELPITFINERQLNAAQLNQHIAALQSGFSLADAPLYRILALTDQNDACTRLYFMAHHLIIDAVSWRLFRDDLKTVYLALERDDTLAAEQILGHKGSSYRQWSDTLTNYFSQDPAALERQKEHWLSIADTAVRANQTLTQMAVPTVQSETVRFEKSLTQTLTQGVHHIYHTQINDLLLSALALALSEFTGQTEHVITLEGHGRTPLFKALDIHRTIGWFTCLYPFALTSTVSDPLHTLVTVKEARAAVPDGGIGYGCFVGFAQRPLPNISFNYLGQFDGADHSEGWAFINDGHTGLNSSPDNRETSTLSFNGAVIEGELTFIISGYLSSAHLSQLAEGYRRALAELSERLLSCQRSFLTPSDLQLNLSRPLLNQLQSEQEIEGIYCANSLQQGFIYHAINQGETDNAYRTQLLWDYHCFLDKDKLREAWLLAQQKFPSLRLRFSWQETLIQIIDKSGRLDWHYSDLSHLETEQQTQAFDDLLKQDGRIPYDLTQSGLFRLTLIKFNDNFYRCIFNNHHAMLDGWSNPVLLSFVHNSYLDLLAGRKVDTTPDTCYAKAQAYLQHHRLENQDYWQHYLAIARDREQENLTALFKTEHLQTSLSDHKEVTLPQQTSVTVAGRRYPALKAFCSKHSVTTNALLQYLWHKLLSLYGSSEITVVGMTVAGRNLPLEGIEQSVGLYINTLPVVLQHTSEPVIELIKRLQTAINDANQHSNIDLAGLQQSGQRLFNTLFVYENYPMPKDLTQDQALIVQFNDVIEKQDYPLVVTVNENQTQLKLKIQYAGELFDASAMVQLAKRFTLLLDQLLEEPTLQADAFNSLQPEEYQTFVTQRDARTIEFNDKQTINALFSQRAHDFPDRIAVKHRQNQLTYAELDAKSNQLAQYLSQCFSLKPNDLVALCLDRSEYLPVAILAVLKAGAAYIPLDPQAAPERLRYMISDSGANVVLTDTANQAKLRQILPASTTINAINDTAFEGQLNNDFRHALPMNKASYADLAYVIYTSGTTGQPKGVMVEHQNVVNLFACSDAIYRFNCQDVWTLFHSYSFDFSVWELWGALLYGGKLIIPDLDTVKDSDAFYDLCQQEQVTVLNQTPNAFYQFIAVAQDKIDRLNRLRYIIFGGEALNFAQLKPWYALYDDRAPQLMNMYGITETTVHVTYKELRATTLTSASLIGETLANYSAYILDSSLNPVPAGVTGELYIGGRGVARGYLNNPELTERRFINHVFADNTCQRLYRTGDLARFTREGDIEYIGRADFQVKIRGFRIELGEIEAKISTYPGIAQSVVLVNEQGDNKRLVAYYIAESAVQEQALIDYLRQYLPDYMIPIAFIAMNAFPLTVNGKLDRHQLPDPVLTRSYRFIPPDNAAEVTLCQIFSEILAIESSEIGIEDDFFKLGGDSISAIQLINRIRSQLSVKLSVKDVFAARTVKELAKKVQTCGQIKTLTEQGVLTGNVELLPIQHWFFKQVELGLYQAPNHWNQAVMINTPTLNIDVLRAAIQRLVQYHDALRLRFSAGKKQYRQQYQPDDKTIEFTAVDLNAFANQEALNDQLTQWQSHFDIEKGPLYHIGYLYDGKSGTAKLHLALHHLIVDAVSLRLLKDNLQTLYSALSDRADDIDNIDAERILGDKGTSYRQWHEVLTRYADRHQDQIDYWRAINDEIKPFNQRLATMAIEQTHAVSLRLAERETRQILRDIPPVYHSQINDILLTALVLTLEENLKLTGYPILLEGHGREDIEESLDIHRTVGWFTSFYPVLLSAKTANPERLLIEIKDRLSAIPDHGIGFGPLLGYQSAELPKIAFNYLGNFSHSSSAQTWHFSQDDIGTAVSELNQSDVILNINGWVIDNRLTFSIAGKLPVNQLEKLALTYQYQLRRLTKALLTHQRRFLTCSDVGFNISQTLLDQLQSEKEVEAIYFANSLQQGFIYHALSQGDKDEAYRTQMQWDYYCELDESRLKQAWLSAQTRYPALRLRFSWQEEIVQVIDKHSSLCWTNIDLTMLDEGAQRQRVDELLFQDKHRAYDLSQSGLFQITLIKLRDDRYTCIFNNHHAILDGWSNPLLLTFVHDCYLKLTQGQHIEVNGDNSYPQAQAYLQNQRQQDDSFWQRYLSQFEDSENLSALLKPEMKQLTLSDYRLIKIPLEQELVIGDADYRALKAFCQSQGVTLNAVLQYCWHKQLSLYGNADTTLLGMTVAGRHLPIEGIEQSVGLFINTLPVIFHHSDLPVKEKLTELQNTINEINHRGGAQLAKLQKGGQRLFNTLFVFENYPTADETDHGQLRFKMKSVQEKMDYPLAVIAYEADKQIIFKLRYAGELFDKQTVDDLLGGINRLLTQLLANPNIKENEFDYLDAALANRILTEWNNTAAVYPSDKTIAELFSAQAAKTPDAIAVKWQNTTLTYRQLDQLTNRLAHRLKTHYHIQPDDLIALCLDRSHNIIIALLAILKAGGAYVPIDPQIPNDRLNYILTQTQAKAAIINDAYRQRFEKLLPDSLAIEAIDRPDYWQHLQRDYPDTLPSSDATPASLAYVLFTSGTTGHPKGVMIEQRSFTNLIYHTGNSYFTKCSAISTFSITNYVFDIWGLEYGLPLLSGGFIALANSDFDTIAASDYNFIQMTPSVWSACADNIIFDNPDLLILLGGEPLTAQLIEKFFRHNQAAAIINVYGPTETTIWSTTQVNTANQYDSCIGRPISNTSVYILTPEKKPVPIGVPGELYIGGDGVGRGYLNNAELTAASYIKNPFQSEAEKQQGFNGRLYKTGDLVRYLPDGRIEFIGRNDFQVKIRGLRIELGEIEARITAHPSVRQAIVVAKERESGNKYLAAYYTEQCPLDPRELQDYLAGYLADYMIPSQWVRLEEFPLTPNGKVNRKALPDVELSAEPSNRSTPSTPLEQTLCQLFAETLGLEQTELSTDDNFFSLGGDSILVIKLTNKINRLELGTVRLTDIFDCPTVKSLAERLQTADAPEQIPLTIEVNEEEQGLPALSFAQERLWFIDQYEKGTHAYNVPMVFRINNGITIDSLRLALQTVVCRHQVLRSLIKQNEDGEYYQEVLDYPLLIETIHLDTEQGLNANIEKAINHVFTLSEEYPIRATLYQLADERLMSIVVHHIAFDGWSSEIFIREVLCHYRYFESMAAGAYPQANEYRLPPLTFQYKDYAAWQRKRLSGEFIEKQSVYWLERLADFETLNLPTDYVRPPQITYCGDDVILPLDGQLDADLRRLAQQQGVTLYSVLLSAYYLLLSAYSHQNDIVVGTPIANRDNQHTADLIGFFANTLALRQRIDKSHHLEHFIKAVAEAVKEAQNHQELPFEHLVHRLNVNKDASRHPIFQVIFTMESFAQSQSEEVVELFEPYETVLAKVAKFDLSLTIRDDGSRLFMVFNYATSLFRPETVTALAHTYAELLKQFVANHSLALPLKQLKYVDQRQIDKIINDWNATDCPYPVDTSLPALFEAVAAEVADRTALVCNERELSYAELNVRANQLAHYLIHRYQIGEDTVIGLYLDRSEQMIVCMLAILKVGAAYAPIDPAVPLARAAHIIDQIDAPLIITQSRFIHLLQPTSTDADLIAVDTPEFQGLLQGCAEHNLNIIVKPQQLAYVIHTSGTTGVPKGVMIEHRSALNFIYAASSTLNVAFDPDRQRRSLWLSNYVFDAHIYDVYGALLNGNRLYILTGEQRTDLNKIKRLVEQQQIDFGYIPPVLLEKEVIVPLNKLIVAGEVTNSDIVESYINAGIEIYNLYGPTEISVGSHIHRFTPNDKNTCLGQTIANDRSYIVDEHMKLLPVGAIGELYIGGAGVSRGYLNNPSLTAERFVSNPFRTESEVRAGINERLYKTGDLAKYAANGNIEYCGRNDFQVKIRGLRIELAEIEACLSGYTEVQKVAVLAQRYPGDNAYIAAYYVADDEIDADRLNDYLCQKLPDYMIPARYVFMTDFPYTMNGKLDRRRLPEPQFDDLRSHAEPQNPAELTLRQLFADVLKRPVDAISVEESFFALGGNSILVTKLANLAAKYCGKELPVSTVFSQQTVRKIAHYWQQSEADVGEITPVKLADPRQQWLSFAQQRLWFIESLHGGNSAYNISVLLELEPEADVDAFTKAIQSVVHRHHVLRSVIKENSDGLGYQMLIDDLKTPLVIEQRLLNDLPALKQSLSEAHSVIFKLSDDYPIKVTHYQIQHQRFIGVVVHHIAFDGWSGDILLKEIAQFYRYHRLHPQAPQQAEAFLPPPLTVQYKDYALWQRRYLDGDQRRQQLAFWQDRLCGYTPLMLPLDKVRPVRADHIGENISFSLTETLSDDLRRVAGSLGVSLYGLMLSGYYLLLMAFSNQDDIVVGTPSANRNRHELEGLVGFFVNSLVLRQKIDRQQTVAEFISQVGKELAEVHRHQDLPFDLLVNELHIEQDLSKNPIFQVLFTLQSFGNVEDETLNRLVKIYNVEDFLGQSVAKFDMTTMIDDSQPIIRGVFNFATALFNRDTVNGYVAVYQLILEQLAQLTESENHSRQICQLTYIRTESLTEESADFAAMDWSQFEV